MGKPIVVLLWHKKLNGAEIQDLNKDLGVTSFTTIAFFPETSLEHERFLERHKPARVMLPRVPLNGRAEALPFSLSPRALAIAPHVRPVYEPYRRHLRPIQEELAKAA